MEMMERIVAPSNVREAYRRVIRNGGSPGVDGMTVKELPTYLAMVAIGTLNLWLS
jgi:RNA-directed DNA polymerase